MPLLRNKFQPYFPDPDSPNNYQCGAEKYCHPVQAGDTVWSQFYQTPCNASEITDPEFDDYTLGAELVLNGTFNVNPAATWNYDPEWTWDAGNTEMDCLNGSGAILEQTGLGVLAGNIYRITFDTTITNGEFVVLLGYGDPLQTQTPAITISGSYEFDLQFNATGTETITFLTSNSFTGSVTNVSIKLINFTYWNYNSSWILSDGEACHIPGQIGDLEETVANYIDAGDYYKVSFTVSGRTQGSIAVNVSNVSTGGITSNGTFTYWKTPTLAGVVSISATSTFDGCISGISLYKLKNDYAAELVDSNGNSYDVSNSFEYYEDYVTLGFAFEDYDLDGDCYNLKVYDECIITSDNLVTNGDFANGYTDWVGSNAANQYDIIGDQFVFKFFPFNYGYQDWVTNGNFSSGTAWTINAGWAVAGGKAIHSPGNTGTLFQTLSLPAFSIGQVTRTYTIGFKVTNWTQGTINLKVGTASNGTTYTWAGNDTFIQWYQPYQTGNIDLIFTPSSNFDGEIDDVKMVEAYLQVPYAFITHTSMPLITPGTYQFEYELISNSYPTLGVKGTFPGSSGTTQNVTVPGLYSYTLTYNSNGGVVRLTPDFYKTSNLYSQFNMVEGTITIDNISLKKVEPFEASFTSECLQFSYENFNRTKMLVGWCDQPSFGFEFANTGFRLQQRAEVRSIAPVYPKETIVMKSGTGNARVAYSEVEKYWQLHTGFGSETFHDAMAVIISCDHFQIGDTEDVGVEYVSDPEDYSPNWQGDGSYSLATAVVNLRVKEKGQVFNRHT